MAWYGRDYEDRGYRGGGTFDSPYNRGTHRGYRVDRGFGGNRDFGMDRDAGYRARGFGYDRDLHPGERMVVRPGGMDRDRYHGGGHDRDWGDRLREGWHDLKRGVRDVFTDEDEHRYGARERPFRNYDRDFYANRGYRGYNRGMW